MTPEEVEMRARLRLLEVGRLASTMARRCPASEPCQDPACDWCATAALLRLLITAETEDFDQAVPIEAAHQVARWGPEHDAGKSPTQWFWLIGYLAGKALAAALAGDRKKAKHHTISTAAALRNWHGHLRAPA